MNVHEQNLLSFLRTALWGVPASCDTPDWRTLLRLAEKQTVTGLIYDVALTLPPSQQPDGELLRTLHLHTVRIAQSHQLLNTTLAEIVSRLRTEGIRTVLLKGQGVARNYPNPLRRGCGDIDLYVGEPEYTRACRLLNEWGMLDGEKTAESIQHLHFTYNGVCIEIHRIAGIMFSRCRNRLFRRWSDELLQEDSYNTMQIDGTLAASGGTQVLLPPVRFDAFYLFYHTYKHFLTGGVGLRQFCDWTMYLHDFADEIDRTALKEDLHRFRLLHPWQVMGHIAVRHLGLPQEEFPFFSADAGVKKTADAMLELILQSGNFGFHNPNRTRRPDGYLAGKLHSFRLMHRRLWQVFPLCPADTLCYYSAFLTKGIAQLFKDTFTKPIITGAAR